jgi:outer membrane protein insertion porin family
MINYSFKIILKIFLILFFLSCAENLYGQDTVNTEFEIKSLYFSGNTFYSDGYLEDLISLHESPGRSSQFFYTISSFLGSPPYYYDSTILSGDKALIEKKYFDDGYLDVKIDTRFSFPSKKEISIEFLINEGHRYIIDSIFIENIDTIVWNVKDEILLKSYIIPPVNYSTELILKEKNRIIQVLSNNGYPECFIDNKSIRLYKKLNKNFNLYFSVNIGRKFYFGKTEVIQEGEKKQRIADEIIYEQLEYEQNQPYSIEKKLESERNFSRLGIFDYARIETPVVKLGDTLRYIPISVLFKTKNRYELSPEIFVNNQDFSFNLGLGLSAILRNIGGGAQSISATTRIRAQSIEQGNVDFSLQWLQPYFLDKKFSLNITSSLGLDYRTEYRQNILQNKFGITCKFKEYNFFKYAFFDWDLERAEVTSLIDTTRITDQDTKDLFAKLAEPQFNSIFNITLQHDNTNDPFSPSKGNYLSVSIAEAGFIPALLIKDRSKLRYAQFVRLTIFGKYYESLSNTSIFASKIKFGYARQYGDDQNLFPIPLTQRFFGGGSLSVRGWKARELGNVASPLFGGNIVIEGNFELREHLFLNPTSFGFLELNKLWMVVFTDFGNIWDKLKDISPRYFAIACGLGLRYDSVIGPLRIDWGFRVYDPADQGNKWINQKILIKEVLAKGLIHFGIGNAF